MTAVAQYEARLAEMQREVEVASVQLRTGGQGVQSQTARTLHDTPGHPSDGIHCRRLAVPGGERDAAGGLGRCPEARLRGISAGQGSAHVVAQCTAAAEPSGSGRPSRAALRIAFTPVDDATTAREQLDRLKQGRDSATFYAQRFRQIVTRIPTLQQADLVHRFTSGLRESVAQQVRIQRPETLEAAMLIAARADDHSRGGSAMAHPRFQQRTSRPSRGSGADGLVGAAGAEERSGGRQRPSLSSKELAQLMSEGRCFNCKQHGHRARECPQRNGRGAPGNRGKVWGKKLESSGAGDSEAAAQQLDRDRE